MGACGGTLIGPNIVLGTAHCNGFTSQFVTVGGNFTITAEVVEERVHPNYNEDNFRNDFSLYRLKSPVTTTAGAQVVVNTNGALPSDGQSLTTIGHLSGGGWIIFLARTRSPQTERHCMSVGLGFSL